MQSALLSPREVAIGMKFEELPDPKSWPQEMPVEKEDDPINPTTTVELRKRFLSYFERREHLVVPSASLIPAGDPTLLLTNAGMVQFKPFFTGEDVPPHTRLTSVQKCFRTTDIDLVGDATHLTFFEMLGNFSVGDYFKSEAIAWAWDFVTNVLSLDPDRIWATVFTDDQDAFGIWKNQIGLPEAKILKSGEADNYWGPAGIEGPCGPCSELHYDLHPELGSNGDAPNDDSGRFLEIWNLVFMQFYQDREGNRTLLPSPNIDTGMGLERTAAVLQRVDSVYDTDIWKPIIGRVADFAKVSYGQNPEADYAIRVVAEHSRSAAFLISDGVTPSNEGRGYILRRLIRRGSRYGKMLSLESPVLPKVAEAVIENMREIYPELGISKRFVLKVLGDEEDRFDRVISGGMTFLENVLVPLHSAIQNLNTNKIIHEISDLNSFLEILGSRQVISDSEIEVCRKIFGDNLRSPISFGEISGQEAFFLYDTHGFPLELTKEVALEHALNVDEDSFWEEMDQQRERSRTAGKFGGDSESDRLYVDLDITPSKFVGYETLSTVTIVQAILKDGISVKSANHGDQVEIIIEETPFYAEGGGQVGDTGKMTGGEFRLVVRDTQSPVLGRIIHLAEVSDGTVKVGDTVNAEVDALRREDIMRNHTATHLLHEALRKVLGPHVRQAGSLVAQDYLRFDFIHTGQVAQTDIDEIQEIVNRVIRGNVNAEKREILYREAVSGGALAFFGDRYPEHVRVLEIGDFSYEVCGGTHVTRSGDIGLFKITNEHGIGAGLRRIEAVTGRGADKWIDERLEMFGKIMSRFQSNPENISHKIDSLLDELEQSRKTIAGTQRETIRGRAESVLDSLEELGNIPVLIKDIGDISNREALREMGDWLRDHLKQVLLVLGGTIDGRPELLVMISKDILSDSYNAVEIVREAAKVIEGGGGGRPDMAQAGGKRPELMSNALNSARELILSKSRLK